MDVEKIKKEFLKCKNDPIYFISNYIKITHPVRGLVNFELYPFQRRLIKEFRENRFNILRKFRQAGCTTLTAAYSLHQCIFNGHFTTVILSKGDAESTEVLERTRIMYEELPQWLKPPLTEINKHTIRFSNNSVIKSRPSSKQSGRSLSASLLILDEAAFIEYIDTIWAAAYPVISTGGSVIALSTVNGVGNWFHRTYSEAVKGSNKFRAIDIQWRDHPEYFRQEGYEKLYEEMSSRNPPVLIDEWEKTTRSNMNHKQWLQEYEGDFLGTGDTFIDGEILRQLQENTNDEYTIKYNNRMRIWKQPHPSHDYIIGADCSLGRGLDYSAFHILDAYTGEQVAEFYSNKTPLNEFAKILAQEGRAYNLAYIIPERNLIGHNLIYFLHQVEEYENLYMDDSRELGLQLTDVIRRQILVEMDDFIRGIKIKINSERTVNELLTFIIDENNKYIADTNCHDDLVMSLALSVHALKNLTKSTPIDFEQKDDDLIKYPGISLKRMPIKTHGGLSKEDITWLIKD